MRADLAAFARTGACRWPAYDTDRRWTMCYDLTPELVSDPAGAERALWDDVV